MAKRKMRKEDRYKYLINARNFHYDNFNKWMTYFYVAIGALFIGYYTIAANANLEIEKKALLILGFITSLLWYWSSKGYYFWNINFITLVNDCEKKSLKLKKKERIYFVFANKATQNNYLSPISGANVSTSKVAILFSFLVTIVWGTLLSANFFNSEIYVSITISVLSTFILSAIIPQYCLKSKIDHFPDRRIQQN